MLHRRLPAVALPTRSSCIGSGISSAFESQRASRMRPRIPGKKVRWNWKTSQADKVVADRCRYLPRQAVVLLVANDCMSPCSIDLYISDDYDAKPFSAPNSSFLLGCL